MRFFVPDVNDGKKAEEIYVAIIKFAEDSLGWKISNRRIFNITYEYKGKEYHAEVGKISRRVSETITAILDSEAYLICTPNRGVERGAPILVGKSETITVVDFED